MHRVRASGVRLTDPTLNWVAESGDPFTADDRRREGSQVAHIAGYALAEIGPWLPFEEQEGRLARKSDAAAAHSEWGFQGEHRLRRVDFRDGLRLGSLGE